MKRVDSFAIMDLESTKNLLQNRRERERERNCMYLPVGVPVREEKTPTIVITAPHAACVPVSHLLDQGHYCDLAAERASLCLAQHLKKVKLFINSDVPRTRQNDMNRQVSRNTEFRKKILDYATENKDNIAFVLDVHSFPPTDRHYGPWELVVLDDFFPVATYTLDFVRAMRREKIVTVGMHGKTNDIHFQMRRDVGLQSFLVEFKEGLSTQRLENVICPAVATWLSNM